MSLNKQKQSMNRFVSSRTALLSQLLNAHLAYLLTVIWY